MSSQGTMDFMVRAYAEHEEEFWKAEHNAVKLCWKLEELMVMGRNLFRLMSDLDGLTQYMQMKQMMIGEQIAPFDRDSNYRPWLARSEYLLTVAQRLIDEGHELVGYDEFHTTVEEARAVHGNMELGADMPSIEEMQTFVTNRNPDPSRYGE